MGEQHLRASSVVLPVGCLQEDMSLGVQVMGKSGEDELTLTAALDLEKAFGGQRMAAL